MTDDGALIVDIPVTSENFDEARYLAANPDVAAAVRDSKQPSAREHFDVFGRFENRCQRRDLQDAQARKLTRIAPLLKLDMAHERRGAKYDFLTEDLRHQSGISATDAISKNNYQPPFLELIAELRQGIILDCGAGQRPVYYPNVVNYEIVDYDTTDVLGVGEALPFKDASFDAVFSNAVLEHVRDPSKCAAEIARVLKPRGRLLAIVPFLQPLHGYPHHYFNMTHQGLRSLFDRALIIDDQTVPSWVWPISSLTWIVKSWAEGLPEKTRARFLDMRLEELLTPVEALREQDWVTELPAVKNFELASATMLRAHKPA